MDPEVCYLGYEISLRTDADKATMENVFEFVHDDSTVRILPPHSRRADYLQLIEQQGGPALLGEMLVRAARSPARSWRRRWQRPGADARTAHRQHPGGAGLGARRGGGRRADASKKQVKEGGSQESRSVRVDADKLDQLINLVGELIIAGANVNLIAHRRAQIAELQESTSKLSMLVEEVRDSALQLRMVKIGATFNRFQPRGARRVARTGQGHRPGRHGEETELDKTVVEKIGDPLMHLVRNSMDHGIEPPTRGLPRQAARARSNSMPSTTPAASSSPCRTTAAG
jgi:two-component system chemotaxis sensor kinase CheA